LAEFLKSPLQGLLLRHFGIAKEYYRAQGLSAETPLAIDMPVQWAMQMELLQRLAAAPGLGDQAAVDAAAVEIFAERFRDRQRQGAAPGGFIGDFERAARRDATLVPLAFLDFYRQARPENGASGAAPLAGAPKTPLPPIDELCAAPVAHDVAVDGDMHAHYPPDRLFPAWLGWLEELANGGRRASFTALVLDFTVPAAATFAWECTQEAAAQTLRGLREAAADYLARPDGEGGKYLTWKYAKLAEAWHKEEGDWGAAAATARAHTESEWRPDDGGYSSDLVIEQTLAQRVLAPDEIADDLDHLARALAERGETMYGAFLAGVGRVLYTNKKPGKAHGATGGKRQPAAQDKKAPATKARKPRSKA
ncbi:MAG: hypothetical protein J6333_01920, partial [Planctomycetes bacterium]|nr:hypothetical protein [Planctomycetota bacterium]